MKEYAVIIARHATPLIPLQNHHARMGASPQTVSC
jgi:hypothetical protein